MRLARNVSKFAASREEVESSTGNGSFMYTASEEHWKWKRLEQEDRVSREGIHGVRRQNLMRTHNLGTVGRTLACISVWRIEGSSGADSMDGIGAHVTNSCEIVSIPA